MSENPYRSPQLTSLDESSGGKTSTRSRSRNLVDVGSAFGLATMVFLSLFTWTHLALEVLGVSHWWYHRPSSVRLLFSLPLAVIALLLAGFMSYREWTGRSSKVDLFLFLTLLATFLLGVILHLVIIGPK
jgi:hypothetical protein